jgi:hypothetical protein
MAMKMAEARGRGDVLERLEAELERMGFLLEHDKTLPSATTLIAGQPIIGSWWGHPRGHEIFAVLGELAKGAGALCVKLLNAKRTYVHPRLYAAFFSLVEATRADALGACSPPARELFELTERRGVVRMADIAAVVPVKAATAAIRELDERCLVRVDSEHTASGKHEKTLESWTSWRARHAPDIQIAGPAEARAALSSALECLVPTGSKAPKLAL